MQTTILTFLFMACAGWAVAQSKGASPGPPAGPGLTLTTPDFADGGVIPGKFTFAVRNAGSPKLEWSHVPAGTVSFALIFHDPDEALNKKIEDVLHWLVFNIPGTDSLPI
jgi:phosphatidylethanolamine-binding protein (PEBP) family uncharacterized protein